MSGIVSEDFESYYHTLNHRSTFVDAKPKSEYYFVPLIDFVLFDRGVFQTLVEKHFPAPDRGRINRLLGLESKGKPPPPAPAPAPALRHVHTVINNGNGVDDDASASKRKCKLLSIIRPALRQSGGGR